MAYEKQNFKDGQVLKAEHLNKIEAWMSIAQPPREEVVEGYILPEKTLTGEGEMMITDEFHLQVGQTYTVKWNGAEYTCTSTELEAGLYGIGNFSVMGGADTGEPFVIVCDNSLGGGVYGVAIPLDGSSEATVSIYGNIVTVYPLEEKYLPENPLLDLVELGFEDLDENNKTYTATCEDFSVFKSAVTRGIVRVKAETAHGHIDTTAFSGLRGDDYMITAPIWDTYNIGFLCITASVATNEVAATLKTISILST